MNTSSLVQTVTYTFEGSIGAGVCINPVQQVVVVTVNPTPVVTAVPALTTICSSAQTDITLTDPVAGSVIKIVGITISGGAGNITGNSAVNSTFASGSHVTDVLVNTTTSPQTIRYDFQHLGRPGFSP